MCSVWGWVEGLEEEKLLSTSRFAENHLVQRVLTGPSAHLQQVQLKRNFQELSSLFTRFTRGTTFN